MHLVQIDRRPDDAVIASVSAFVDRVAETSGERPLSDHLWLDLRAGGSPGFLLVRIMDESGIVATAQISAANDSSSLEVVVDPALDDERRTDLHVDAAATAVDAFRSSGGGRLVWWLDDPVPRVSQLAARLGLVPVRRLHEMRRALPLDRHASVPTRAFRPGIDDDEWLRVNNRAFAAHDEQGGWTHDTLHLRTSEPWFDPDGFRIHERDGRIAAFCWTKLHDELEPVVGEIYVIAVDPDFHGTGLGRELTLAGLDSIAARGVRVANLYVDADNTAAVGLYRHLGFEVHRTRVAHVGDLEPLPDPPT
ncbi:MAG: mycothiol synthase [Acidimicrobiia bacterium]